MRAWMRWLVGGQGLAEFAQGEFERAYGTLQGSGMEHTGLSVLLRVGLIKAKPESSLFC